MWQPWLMLGLIVGGILFFSWEALKDDTDELTRRLREMQDEPEDGEDDDA